MSAPYLENKIAWLCPKPDPAPVIKITLPVIDNIWTSILLIGIVSVRFHTHHDLNSFGRRVMRVAILDDYQNTALASADWSLISGRTEIEVFTDHLFVEDEIVRRLQDFDVICAMRERTPFTRSLIERLPNLKLIISSGMRNRGIDIEAAKKNKTATIVLNSNIVKSEAYQLIGYLPGKNYGTDKDEQIILTNHTDGPSITQDNGALGILGIIKYFSNIPQEKRDRTLLIYLDCRHYMPGMEQAHKDVSWLKKNPDLKDKVVGLIQTEHLGEMDYKEVNGEVLPTGYTEQSYLWTRNNEYLVSSAKKALDRYGWSRGILSVPERPGPSGELQQVWWGVGIIALANELRNNDNCDEYSCIEDKDSNTPLAWDGSSCEVWTCLNVPAYGQGGFLGYYWNKYSDINRWNSELFIQQTSTMIDLTGVLMYSDLEKIKPILTDQSFRGTDMSIAAPIDISN